MTNALFIRPGNLPARRTALIYAPGVAVPKQAMILAAGRGTRLGALGERTPKVLLEIDGEPLMARHLRYLAARGVERVVANASHLGDQLERFAREYPPPPELEIAVEPEALGTAGGVLNALERFSSGPLLVIYGDVILSEEIAPMADLHERESPVATLAVYHSDRAEQKGIVELSGSAITAFREKDPALTSGWVNAGIYIVQPEWLAGFAAGEELDFGHDLFPATLRAQRRLSAYQLVAPVLDIGTPSDLAKARGGPAPD